MGLSPSCIVFKNQIGHLRRTVVRLITICSRLARNRVATILRSPLAHIRKRRASRHCLCLENVARSSSFAIVLAVLLISSDHQVLGDIVVACAGWAFIDCNDAGYYDGGELINNNNYMYVG